MSARLPLAGCTFGWLHQAPLADALRSLSAHGVRAIELTTTSPHMFTTHFGSRMWLTHIHNGGRPR